jgi:transposase
VDECGTRPSLSAIYGYAPRGERLYLPVPRTRGKNTTLLSSMTTFGMGPSLDEKGATTARVFETYVEKVLLPSLEPGQIVVMDNLGAHRPKRIRELVEQQGCKLLYLPAYSPDYNPIEQACAKIKNLLRTASARTKETLVEAIGVALSAVTAADARASSSMPDTVQRLIYCETCCEHPRTRRRTYTCLFAGLNDHSRQQLSAVPVALRDGLKSEYEDVCPSPEISENS